jgi:hypothetical protein
MGAAASELIAPGTLLGKYRVIHRIAFLALTRAPA